MTVEAPAHVGIRIEGAVKRYGRQTVVDTVTASIAAGPGGGVTALIGPNGAGKSTLLSLAARLSSLDAGRIAVGGLDVAATPSPELAKRLAVLRQENVFAARLSVRDLIGFGRYPHARGRLTEADRAPIERAIAAVGMEQLQHRFIDELSGGQRQRALIAMVLAQETEYVLLDEPLNNLDLKHAVAIMRLLRRAADEDGRRIVVVLHDVNFASAYADEVVAMQDGRIVAQGPPAQVLTPSVLRDLYELDIPVHEVDGMRVAMYYRP